MRPGTNLIVFRDVSEDISGRALAQRLRESVDAIRLDRESILSSLILAGQLECALADCGAPCAEAAALTDLLAENFLEVRRIEVPELYSLLENVEPNLPDQVRISDPEGFAYYGLHPRDFADAFSSAPDRHSIAIVGIRSIGTTLSAVATAALSRVGVPAARMTVRPVGHPYDRETSLTDEQASWVKRENLSGSRFVIVDEGPGLSGSSFLSVAEALEQKGIAAQRITLIGTHEVTPERLCARDAPRRWNRYNWRAVDSHLQHHYSSHIPLSGGLWRNLLLSQDADWPACWPEMEAIKFLSHDRRRLFKFEGLGRNGQRSRQRASALFDAGFGPRFVGTDQGMSCYEVVPGTPMTAIDLSTEVLDRIAMYCAFRSAEFRAERHSGQLHDMLRFNFSQEFGGDIELPAGIYEPHTPIIADTRIQPHKWVRSNSGAILKVDGASDGEGHFLPGPTDISWDLAGATVEWNMNQDAEGYLITKFQTYGGRTSEPTLSAFVLAYSIFRMSFCKMALSSTQDTAEKARLGHAVSYYRSKALHALHRPHLQGSEVELRS